MKNQENAETLSEVPILCDPYSPNLILELELKSLELELELELKTGN